MLRLLPALLGAMSAASRRRDLLISLAKSAPRALLTMELTPAERGTLPPAALALLEQRVRAAGELRVLHVDRPDGSGEYDMRLVDGQREQPVTFGVPLGA